MFLPDTHPPLKIPTAYPNCKKWTHVLVGKHRTQVLNISRWAICTSPSLAFIHLTIVCISLSDWPVATYLLTYQPTNLPTYFLSITPPFPQGNSTRAQHWKWSTTMHSVQYCLFKNVGWFTVPYIDEFSLVVTVHWIDGFNSGDTVAGTSTPVAWDHGTCWFTRYWPTM